MSFRTGSNETKPVGSVGFPRTRCPALPAAVPGSTARVIAPESLRSARIRAKFHLRFLRRARLSFPLSDDALRRLYQISARRRGSGRRSVTWSSHRAPSPAQHRAEKPEERNPHKQTQTDYLISGSYCNIQVKILGDSARLRHG